MEKNERIVKDKLYIISAGKRQKLMVAKQAVISKKTCMLDWKGQNKLANGKSYTRGMHTEESNWLINIT